MTQSNQTAQTMEDGLKPVNLFDAVPYIAQTRFENEFNSYDDVDFQNIQKGIKQIYIMTSKQFPKQFWKDHYYKTVKTMLCNAIELVLENSEEYNKYCRVDTDQLNREHKIEFYIEDFKYVEGDFKHALLD